MDMLFAQIMLHGRRAIPVVQPRRRSPGRPRRPARSPPPGTEVGTLIYRRGDRFYNFAGLRAFKQVRPRLDPQYLAMHGGLGLLHPHGHHHPDRRQQGEG
ncbi:MAG: hypothetical protein R3C69_02615 [Geminicoccaceae bacterium]